MQTKSGYPRRSRQPYPSAAPDTVAEPATDAVALPAGPALLDGPDPSTTARSELVDEDPQPAPEAQPSRVDRRAARRMRRNLAIACGVVVAVCLILTILIVNMARTRPSALALPPRPARGVHGPSAVSVPFPGVPISMTRDAPASEGGNP